LKILLLSVGKDKGPSKELAEEYAKRIGRFAEVELLELKAMDLARARGELWALDQRGVELTSEQLAERVGRTAQITVCVGGDEGLPERARAQASFVWSLGRLTLPHRLARIIALEQLYRSFEILRHGPYHK
jgi:23S rRNA (pseudouridine1915-N3)-methyltransferase